MTRYFFDTSALVKHYHVETGTDLVDRFIHEPGAELASATSRARSPRNAKGCRGRNGSAGADGEAELNRLSSPAHQESALRRTL